MVKEPCPLERVREITAFPSTKRLTVPVGGRYWAVTVTVEVTDWPNKGDDDERESAVVVGSALTV